MRIFHELKFGRDEAFKWLNFFWVYIINKKTNELILKIIDSAKYIG